MKAPLATAVVLATFTLAPPLTGAAERPADNRDAGPRIERAQEIIGDGSITGRIKAELARDKSVSAATINVDTKDGVVTLSGTAKTREEAEKAAAIAKRSAGVRSVKNDIRVGSR